MAAVSTAAAQLVLCIEQVRASKADHVKSHDWLLGH